MKNYDIFSQKKMSQIYVPKYPLQSYADVFGGSIKEWLDTIPVGDSITFENTLKSSISESEYFLSALEQLDLLIEHDFECACDIPKNITDWLNSPLVDKLSKCKPCKNTEEESDGYFLLFKECHLNVLKWIHANRPKLFEKYEDREKYVFSLLCSSGNLEGVNWMLEKFPHLNNSTMFGMVFSDICGSNNLELVKMAIASNPKFEGIHEELEAKWGTGVHIVAAFLDACRSGNLEIVKYMYDKLSITTLTPYKSSFYTDTIENKELFLWLNGKFPIDFVSIDTVYRIRCIHQDLESVKLLDTIDTNRVYIDIVSAFTSIFSNTTRPNMDLVKYIWGKIPQTRKPDLSDTLKHGILYDNLDLILWVCETVSWSPQKYYTLFMAYNKAEKILTWISMNYPERMCMHIVELFGHYINNTSAGPSKGLSQVTMVEINYLLKYCPGVKAKLIAGLEMLEK